MKTDITKIRKDSVNGWRVRRAYRLKDDTRCTVYVVAKCEVCGSNVSCTLKQLKTKSCRQCKNSALKLMWIALKKKRAKGVDVYWRKFGGFARWALSSGYSVELYTTLVRKDPEKGYSPENCYWEEGAAHVISKGSLTDEVRKQYGISPLKRKNSCPELNRLYMRAYRARLANIVIK